MLVLMFDPRFKTMLLVTMYVGCEIIVVVIVEYDKNCWFRLRDRLVKVEHVGVIALKAWMNCSRGKNLRMS
jgi:hypothetical protein